MRTPQIRDFFEESYRVEEGQGNNITVQMFSTDPTEERKNEDTKKAERNFDKS